MAFNANDFIANITSRLGWNGSHTWSFYGLKRGTAWCAAEISYTFNKIGAKSKWFGGKPVFYVPSAQIWMAKNYKTVYDYKGHGDFKNIQKGDIIIFMWSRGSRDHIGACRATTGSATQILTIEGNTSGHKVANRTRAKKNVWGAYRPPWGGSPTPEPLQPLEVDGEFGVLTKMRLQRWLGVEEDGAIGKKTVRALQRKLGMSERDIDGEWGRLTTRALQTYLTRQGFPVMVDGVRGKATVKALQKFLNREVTT